MLWNILNRIAFKKRPIKSTAYWLLSYSFICNYKRDICYNERSHYFNPFIHQVSFVSDDVCRYRNDCRRRRKINNTVDETDFRICEPNPMSKKWFSLKLNGPGLRYEIGISCAQRWIFWTNRPFPCVFYSDPKIFRGVMKKALLRDELVIIDGTYRDKKCRIRGNLQATKRYGI